MKKNPFEKKPQVSRSTSCFFVCWLKLYYITRWPPLYYIGGQKKVWDVLLLCFGSWAKMWRTCCTLSFSPSVLHTQTEGKELCELYLRRTLNCSQRKLLHFTERAQSVPINTHTHGVTEFSSLCRPDGGINTCLSVTHCEIICNF